MREHHDRQTMERLREHLARADNELRAAQHFLDPGSAEDAETDLVHAVAAARRAVAAPRRAVADALERVRSRLGEPKE